MLAISPLSKTEKIPLKVRIWAAVRNKPGSTVAEVMEYIKNDNRGSVSSILSFLECEDVVYSVGTHPRKYFTLLEKYELQPRKKPRPYAPRKPKDQAMDTTPSAVQPEPPKTDRIDEVFNTYTFNECRELYRRLNDIFGV